MKREHVGIGKAHYHRADGLRQGARVDEIVVREMRIPIEIVVDGVINALVVLAGVTGVERSNAKMVEERREVGT